MTDIEVKNLMNKESELNEDHYKLITLFCLTVPRSDHDEEYLEVFNEYKSLANKYRSCISDIIDTYDRYVKINFLKEEGIEPPTEEDYNRCMSYDLHDEHEAVAEKMNKFKED